MPSVYRALSFSLLERLVLVGVMLISYVLIARLLTPEEIGIYSVATALVAIGQVVRDFGIGNFLIQEKALTRAHIRTAYGIAFLIGGSLFVLFVIAAPFVAQFYRDDRMAGIVRIVAINFLIMPFCSISLALLRREMQFGRLMKVNVVAAIVGAAVTLGLAFGKFGPQSLAWGAIAVNAVTGFGAWLARDDREYLLPSLSEWRKVLTFGSQSAGAAIVTTVAMDINDLVVARVLGFAPTAMINRANGLVSMFSQQVMGAVRGVALPAFARAHRANQELEPLYVASVVSVTAIAWPFYGFIALHSQDIVRIMFGSQWDEAAALVPILCISGALAATYNLALTLAIAIGRNDAAAKTDLVAQPIRAMILVAAALLFRSLEAIAWATVLVSVLSAPFFLWVKDKLLPTDKLAMRRGLTESFLLTFACLVVPLVSVLLLSGGERAGPFSIFAQALATLICWVLAMFWLGHPLSEDRIVVRARDTTISRLPLLGPILRFRIRNT